MIYDLNIKIDDSFKLPKTQFGGRGKHCFVHDCPEWVKEEFGLEGRRLVLKVFHIPVTDKTKVERLTWGDNPKEGQPRRNTNFLEATRIQNIAHMHGLAPRVWALLLVEYNGKKCITQLTDDVRGQVVNKQFGVNKNTDIVANFQSKHEDSYDVYESVIELGKIYGFEVEKKDVSKWDVINGQLVDFQTFAFNDEYLPKIKEIYRQGTKWGKIYYHAVPELDINRGPRKMDKRIEEMGLHHIDFEGKTVLDLGSSGGLFVRYALDHGAKRAIGIDFPEAATGADLVSNHLGYYNAEFYGMDLREETTESIRKVIKTEKVDIVFYLSMFRHVHYPPFVWELCKETGIIEWNNWKTEDEIKALVEQNFVIDRMGRTTDHGTGKDFYICSPKK